MSATTLDVISVSGCGIRPGSHPMLSAAYLVAHPGSTPSVTVPVQGAVAPGADEVWEYLAETADFFGVGVPSVAELEAALAAFCAELGDAPTVTALTVCVAEALGATRFLVSGAVPHPHAESVRIDVCDIDFPLVLPEDPHWCRMAARTTSRADRDRVRGWLAARGFADGISARGPVVPYLGALVFDTGDGGWVGLDNPEPTSVLTQLEQCGVIGDVRRAAEPPAHVAGAWWISPEYDLHPVSSLGATRYPVADGPAAFSRTL